MPTRAATQAARLQVLLELHQAGYLKDFSQSDISRFFDVNRSTILRDLRILQEFETILPEMRQKWLKAHPPIKD